MSKLRLVINGTDIDMGSITMALTLSNPMFESVGSHSLPIQITRTKYNDLALGQPHPGVEILTKRFPSQIYMGIVPFYGEFVIESVKQSYIEGYFSTGNATFRELVKDQKLTDIDHTEIIAGSGSVSFTIALEVAARSSYPTYNYTCFPILAQKYWGDQLFSYSVCINPWVYSNTAGNDGGFRALSQPSSAVIYAASFYLCFVISKIFEENGYAIEQNDIYDDEELRTLVIVNFNTLGFTNTYNQYNLKFSESLPPIGINEFITSLEKLFNVTFHISDLDRSVNIKKNTAIIKAQAVKEFTLINREYIPEEHNGFILNYNMDPDDPFSVITPIDDYELGITVDNKEDLASYPASSYQSQLAKITNNDQYYISRLSDVGSYTWEWEPFTKDYFKYAVDSEKLEIITDANPILTDNAELYIDTPLHSSPEHALYPRVDKSGLSDGRREFRTFSTLRLLFYRGIVDSGGLITDPATQLGQYPLASPDVYRPQGLTSPARYGRVKITEANQSLRWGGTYGLYNTHWNDYLYWWQNIKRSAKDYYDMSLSDLLSINFWEKYRADGISFIFRTINFELDFAKDSIRIGECEVYLS